MPEYTYPGDIPIAGPFEAAKLQGNPRHALLTNGGRRWLVEGQAEAVGWIAARLTERDAYKLALLQIAAGVADPAAAARVALYGREDNPPPP